jgi:RES domain-containing protein
VTITAFRITKKEFAASIWSGYGAREYGGRWNSKGVTVVYTAENRSLAAMEQLVHLVKPRILRGYVIASISFDDARMTRIDATRLPAGWKNPVALPALKRYGDDWIAAERSPVLAVPSIVIPGEWNYLINPSHPDFAKMKRSAARAFVYDKRLG